MFLLLRSLLQVQEAVCTSTILYRANKQITVRYARLLVTSGGEKAHKEFEDLEVRRGYVGPVQDLPALTAADELRPKPTLAFFL